MTSEEFASVCAWGAGMLVILGVMLMALNFWKSGRLFFLSGIITGIIALWVWLA